MRHINIENFSREYGVEKQSLKKMKSDEKTFFHASL